jgi:hypothetical protein
MLALTAEPNNVNVYIDPNDIGFTKKYSTNRRASKVGGSQQTFVLRFYETLEERYGYTFQQVLSLLLFTNNQAKYSHNL